MYQQVSDVTADLVLHHGSSQWWSFHDVNSLDAYGCGSLSGPMAVVVSEETPRKYSTSYNVKTLSKHTPVLDACVYKTISFQREFLVRL